MMPRPKGGPIGKAYSPLPPSGVVRPPASGVVPQPPVPAPPSMAISISSPAHAAAAAAQRIRLLEATIEVDPLDSVVWESRIKEELAQAALLGTNAAGADGDNPSTSTDHSSAIEQVFERAVTCLQQAPRIWIMYADWSEGQDTVSALAVYQRCLQHIASFDLWSSYIGFCKRLMPLEEIFRAYARTADLLGTDHRAGAFWAEYLSLLKHIYNIQQRKTHPDAEVSGKLLGEDASPIEVARRTMKAVLKKRVEETRAANLSDEEFLRVADALKIDTDFIRRNFQRAVSTAHAAIEKLWVGYEQFEKSMGNPPLAQKILGEHMSRYVRGKSTFKDLQGLLSGLDLQAVSAPITPKYAAQQTRQMEKWRAFLQFEQTNPLRLARQDLQARVTLCFQQAALCCAYHAELWHDFAHFLDLGGQRAEATACLRKAVDRYLPNDLTLRLVVCQRFELGDPPLSDDSLDAAEAEYLKLLGELTRPCPLALINYLAFMRRQRGGGEFRRTFVEATENSIHCTWEAYDFAAKTEYHAYGSVDAACKVYRLGLERFGEREPSLLVAYVNFLVSSNDLRNARAELSRGILDRLQSAVRDRMSNRTDQKLQESLAFLWEKWSRLERYFGDTGAIRRCTGFVNEEFQNLQREQEVEEEGVVETPAAYGLTMTVDELSEGFRYGHLRPETPKFPCPASPEGVPAEASPFTDHSVDDAAEEHRRLGSKSTDTNGSSLHVSRPDVSKMLAFRPALDVLSFRKESAIDCPTADSNAAAGVAPVGSVSGVVSGGSFPSAAVDPRIANARPGAGGNSDEDQVPLPTMIPKCLQDLLAVLPARPLKGAKPDVDYLLTVLQTVSIPAIQVKELERFRYDSLRLLKEEDNALLRKRGLVKDELRDGGVGFFTSRPTIHRERLQAKRQRLAEELGGSKVE